MGAGVSYERGTPVVQRRCRIWSQLHVENSNPSHGVPARYQQGDMATLGRGETVVGGWGGGREKESECVWERERERRRESERERVSVCEREREVQPEGGATHRCCRACRSGLRSEAWGVGFGFGVWGLGFGVLGLRVWSLECGVWVLGLGFGFWGFGV